MNLGAKCPPQFFCKSLGFPRAEGVPRSAQQLKAPTGFFLHLHEGWAVSLWGTCPELMAVVTGNALTLSDGSQGTEAQSLLTVRLPKSCVLLFSITMAATVTAWPRVQLVHSELQGTLRKAL